MLPEVKLHCKSCGFVNTNCYFDALFAWVVRAYKDHFIYEEHLELYVEEATPLRLLDKLANFKFPENIRRWLER